MDPAPSSKGKFVIVAIIALVVGLVATMGYAVTQQMDIRSKAAGTSPSPTQFPTSPTPTKILPTPTSSPQAFPSSYSYITYTCIGEYTGETFILSAWGEGKCRSQLEWRYLANSNCQSKFQCITGVNGSCISTYTFSPECAVPTGVMSPTPKPSIYPTSPTPRYPSPTPTSVKYPSPTVTKYPSVYPTATKYPTPTPTGIH